MSGGFFRGTSADQDTRFSNKQAKLLKSQKFPPELEHPVDITKVKMDVMKPWIAKRVMELIGFEDEVLINFIYSLLEGKEINGKEVQISLTGFMERNTGKFMKELWSLLLSAQNNVSGVPQQFLDAKEEETKKKKAETDRIANEIQRKKEKEKQDLDQDKNVMDGDIYVSRDNRASLEVNSKHGSRFSSRHVVDEKEKEGNARRGRSRVSSSPDSANHSPSRRGSRSTSRSPPVRRRSISLERRHRSSLKRSLTPRRRHSRSPLHRRSRSPIWHRSRTPVRISPARYRSRSPLRRRSPYAVRHRSRTPLRHRSRSPTLRRSPSIQRRSPSSRWRSQAPMHRRTPPPRRRSPSPVRRRHRRSPSTPLRRSISPVRRRSPLYGRERSLSPSGQRSSSPRDSSSPSTLGRGSASPVRMGFVRSHSSPIQEKIRRREKQSPARCALPSDVEHPDNDREIKSQAPRPHVSLRSPQRDMLDQNDGHGKVPALSSSSRKSTSVSEALGDTRDEERRSSTLHSPHRRKERLVHPKSASPLRKAAKPKHDRDSSGSSGDDDDSFHAREKMEMKNVTSRKSPPTSGWHKDSPHFREIHGLIDGTKSRNTHEMISSGKLSKKDYLENHGKQRLSASHRGTEKCREYVVGEDDKSISAVTNIKGSDQLEAEILPKLSTKTEQNNRSGSTDSGSEGYRHESKIKERKHRRSEREEMKSDDYTSSDSYEDRREAKRRRKEEKKLKKEERRRRREERHRRREEKKRAQKLKSKSVDAGSLSLDAEKDHDDHASQDESFKGQEVSVNETESEQKKLEIELREKALERLRAKKGIRD